MKTSYAAVAEQAIDGSWSAYVPDLPGCTAGGRTAKEALDNVTISIELWLEEASESGIPIPSPKSEIREISMAR